MQYERSDNEEDLKIELIGFALSLLYIILFLIQLAFGIILNIAFVDD